MMQVAFKRRIFPPAVIQHAAWLSFRDVEEALAHRGVDVGFETIRAWPM